MTGQPDRNPEGRRLAKSLKKSVRLVGRNSTPIVSSPRTGGTLTTIELRFEIWSRKPGAPPAKGSLQPSTELVRNLTQRRCAESRTKGFKDKIDSFIPPDRATRNFRGPNPDLAGGPSGASWRGRARKDPAGSLRGLATIPQRGREEHSPGRAVKEPHLVAEVAGSANLVTSLQPGRGRGL